MAAIDTASGPLLYDIVGVTRELSLGKTKTFELIASGELPTLVIGRRRLVARDDLIAYVERLRREQSGRTENGPDK